MLAGLLVGRVVREETTHVALLHEETSPLSLSLVASLYSPTFSSVM